MNSSSRSPPMPSYEPPRTPSPPLVRAGETDGDSSGPSTTGVSSGMSQPFVHSPLKPCHSQPSNRLSISAIPEAASYAVDPDFLRNHFKKAPLFPVAEDIQKSLKAIREATSEAAMYKPAGEALTAISKTFFGASSLTPCLMSHDLHSIL